MEINGKEYELKYNMKRVEMIESNIGMPVMALLQKNSGMLGIADLKTYFALGLRETGSDVFVKPKEGMQIAEEMIERDGYVAVDSAVLEALERDCPFFFRAV